MDRGGFTELEHYRPDISVTDGWESTGDHEPEASGIAVMEPALVIDAGDLTERHIEIVDTRTEHEVVTVIEVISPTNKLSRSGRERYWKKQVRFLDSGVNLVEIDLIRGGQWVVAISEDEIAESKRKAFIACVFCSSRSSLAAYPIGLREPLPCFRIPLRPRDTDILLKSANSHRAML